MRKKIMIIFLVILLCVTVFCIVFFTSGKLVEEGPVENEERAVEIARAYVWKKYHRSFKEYKINVEFFEAGHPWLSSHVPDANADIWVVWYSSASDMGGGGPEVYITKSDGKVIFCYLTK